MEIPIAELYSEPLVPVKEEEGARSRKKGVRHLAEGVVGLATELASEIYSVSQGIISTSAQSMQREIDRETNQFIKRREGAKQCMQTMRSNLTAVFGEGKEREKERETFAGSSEVVREAMIAAEQNAQAVHLLGAVIGPAIRYECDVEAPKGACSTIKQGCTTVLNTVIPKKVQETVGKAFRLGADPNTYHGRDVFAVTSMIGGGVAISATAKVVRSLTKAKISVSVNQEGEAIPLRAQTTRVDIEQQSIYLEVGRDVQDRVIVTLGGYKTAEGIKEVAGSEFLRKAFEEIVAANPKRPVLVILPNVVTETTFESGEMVRNLVNMALPEELENTLRMDMMKDGWKTEGYSETSSAEGVPEPSGKTLVESRGHVYSQNYRGHSSISISEEMHSKTHLRVGETASGKVSVEMCRKTNLLGEMDLMLGKARPQYGSIVEALNETLDKSVLSTAPVKQHVYIDLARDSYDNHVVTLHAPSLVERVEEASQFLKETMMHVEKVLENRPQIFIFRQRLVVNDMKGGQLFQHSTDLSLPSGVAREFSEFMSSKGWQGKGSLETSALTRKSGNWRVWSRVYARNTVGKEFVLPKELISQTHFKVMQTSDPFFVIERLGTTDAFGDTTVNHLKPFPKYPSMHSALFKTGIAIAESDVSMAPMRQSAFVKVLKDAKQNTIFDVHFYRMMEGLTEEPNGEFILKTLRQLEEVQGERKPLYVVLSREIRFKSGEIRNISMPRGINDRIHGALLREGWRAEGVQNTTRGGNWAEDFEVHSMVYSKNKVGANFLASELEEEMTLEALETTDSPLVLEYHFNKDTPEDFLKPKPRYASVSELLEDLSP